MLTQGASGSDMSALLTTESEQCPRYYPWQRHGTSCASGCCGVWSYRSGDLEPTYLPKTSRGWSSSVGDGCGLAGTRGSSADCAGRCSASLCALYF